MATAWDAFISYARADSERTAVAIQRGLERFARPWNQRRAVRVFRDDSAMSTNPALWSAIEDGLAQARNLIVLISPAARDSAYVDREVGWWLDHKGADTILLVLDAGGLDWDEDLNRFSEDSTVPPRLRDAFEEEPRWLDLRWMRTSPEPATDPRFTSAVADLSAPIRGLPRDELVGEDLTQHRRVRRLARGAVSLLALLLVVSITSTALAIQQRDDVLRQAVTLRARGLANTATGLLDSDLRLAQLLAVQGYRTESSATTREALLQAAFASPLIDHFTSFDADITALTTSPDGSTVAVGLADGRVFTVDAEGHSTPVLRGAAGAPVTTLRASSEGSALLVGTPSGISLVGATGLRALVDGPLTTPDAVALSASGRRAAIITGDGSAMIRVYDAGTGAELLRRRDPLAPRPNTPVVSPQYTDRLVFLNDSTMRLIGIDARWRQLDLRTGRTSRAGSARWEPYANLYAASGRGDYLLSAAITGGQAVRAWPLDRTGSDNSPLVAGVQLTDPLGLAISPGGRLVMVNDSSTGLSVAPVRREDRLPVVPATRIAGLSGVTAMEFTGETGAVAAARTDLVFLRFGGAGRGSAAVALFPRGVGNVPDYAVDYRNSGMAVSPDGSRLAVLELEYAELEVVPLPGREGTALGRTSLPTSDQLDALYGPLWLDDDTVLVLYSDPGGVEKGPVAGVARWNLGLPIDDHGDRETPLAAVRTEAGSVLVATSSGRVQTRAATGELVSESGPDAAPGARTAPYSQARFSVDARYLALLRSAARGDDTGTRGVSLRVVDNATGVVVHEQQWPQATDPVGVEFVGTTVLVSHTDGSIDVLPDLGRGVPSRVSTSGTRTSTGSFQRNPPVVGADGLVGFPTRSGLQLYDLNSLQPVGTVPVTPGFETVPRTYAFAPDGHTLVTGYLGGDRRTARAIVQDLDTAAVVSGVCAGAGGAITAAEWLRVVGDQTPSERACP